MRVVRDPERPSHRARGMGCGLGAPYRNTDYWALPREAKTFGICVFNGLLSKVVHLRLETLWPHLNFKYEDGGGRASQPWLHIRITWGALKKDNNPNAQVSAQTN